MRRRRLRFLFPLVLALILAPDVHAQKRGKKRPAQTSHSDHRSPAQKQPAKAVDISDPAPQVPIPQESSLKPNLKKTKKVVIVPAPPPPPGPDLLPPYPKR